MTIRNASAGRSAVSQASRLDPAIQVNTEGITSFGSVAGSRGFSSNSRRMPSAVVFVLDNSEGEEAELFYVGDGGGIVRGKLGLSEAAPATSTPGNTVAAVYQSFTNAPIMVSGINYEATDGDSQFSERFQFADADLDRGQLQDIVVPQYIRNTSQNPNLLTLRFDEQFELDWNAGFFINVGAGQRVTLTLMIGSAAGR